MNFTSANSNATQVYSLALKGVTARAGTFDKTVAAAPAAQVVTTGFRPGAVFMTSFQRAATTQVREPVCSMGIGASDGVRAASSIFSAADGVGTTANAALDKTSKAFLKMNEPPLDGEANLTTLDANGFTLNWTMNDGVASQICYLALGAP